MRLVLCQRSRVVELPLVTPLATMEPMTSDSSTDKIPPTPPQKPAWKSWVDNLQVLAIALILALLLRTFIAEPRFIPSDSMVPTLLVGDRLIVEKVSYRLNSPQRGDIIVFDPPAQLQRYGYAKDQAFIKRVIGLPGQTIEVRDGKVFINDQPLTESYIAEPPQYQMPKVTIPSDSYFVMGDNRNNSKDSHIWGFLPQANIIGRACFRFFPFSRISGLP